MPSVPVVVVVAVERADEDSVHMCGNVEERKTLCVRELYKNCPGNKRSCKNKHVYACKYVENNTTLNRKHESHCI